MVHQNAQGLSRDITSSPVGVLIVIFDAAAPIQKVQNSTPNFRVCSSHLIRKLLSASRHTSWQEGRGFLTSSQFVPVRLRAATASSTKSMGSPMKLVTFLALLLMAGPAVAQQVCRNGFAAGFSLSARFLPSTTFEARRSSVWRCKPIVIACVYKGVL